MSVLMACLSFLSSLAFANQKQSSVFQNTLIFGHSISSNLMYEVKSGTYVTAAGVPIFGPALSTAWFLLTPFYAPGPADLVAKDSRKNIQNKAKGFGEFSEKDLGLAKLIQMQGRDVGHFTAGGNRQLFSRDYKLEQAYQKATAIIGVDAFYMGVLFNECADYNVYSVIGQFIEKANSDGKVTILGNFPDEKFHRMRSETQLVLGKGLNDRQVSCQDIINMALDRFCTKDQNCYLVDLKQIVNDMDKNDGAVVGGRFYTYKQLRPDGANLSAAGSQLIVEKILESMKP